MGLLPWIRKYYQFAKSNVWHQVFSVFCSISLAIGFLTAGFTKVIGERFASGLSVQHPMGHYLEALHHTGYYYTFLGIAQILAAVLLLIPRTVFLGAILYFPIILNIFILSFAVRFEGSMFSSSLMVLANAYLLVWNFDRLQYLLPLGDSYQRIILSKDVKRTKRFPIGFFLGVLAAIVLVFFMITAYEIVPRNSLNDCKSQFKEENVKYIGFDFCECIHTQGNDLEYCIEAYEQAKKEKKP